MLEDTVPSPLEQAFDPLFCGAVPQILNQKQKSALSNRQ
jgi:hypothetical protein